MTGILLLTSFAACTGNKGSDAKTLIIGIESEVKNLDLRTTMDMNSAQVINLFSQSLLQINDKMLPEPELAMSFSDQDARIFEFILPQDALFHDGSPVTCDDVLASFKQASGETSRIKSAFEDVKLYSCPEPFKFRIELNNPKASFLAGDVTAVRILPKKLAESTAEAAPIGSGPYKYVSRDTRDIVFERFDKFVSYKGGTRQTKPYFFDKIIVRTVQDPTTRWLSLTSGEIDVLINALSPQKVVEARTTPGLQVFEKPGNTFQYLGFNLRLPKFKDVRVREAVAHAIDRDSIIQHKLYGLASKANSVISPLNYYHNPNIKDYAYDPELSKKLLKEAKMENLEIEIKTSSDRDVTSIAMVIKEQLEKVGIKVSLKPYEFATFFADVQKGNFETFSLRWVAVTEPDIMHKIFHSSQVPPGRNRVYFSNKEVDSLVDAGARESDVVKRKALYDRAQEIVSEQLPYVPLWYPNNVAVASSRLKDYSLNPIGTWASLLEARKE
ncbi:MAG: ABC transporter substrate-binding protein [Bdellovibrionota bacterium]